MEWLGSKASNKTYKLCLECVRIISREKSGLEALVNEKALRLIVHHAGLETYAKQEGEIITIQDGDTEGKLLFLLPRDTVFCKNCVLNLVMIVTAMV